MTSKRRGRWRRGLLAENARDWPPLLKHFHPLRTLPWLSEEERVDAGQVRPLRQGGKPPPRRIRWQDRATEGGQIYWLANARYGMLANHE